MFNLKTKLTFYGYDFLFFPFREEKKKKSCATASEEKQRLETGWGMTETLSRKNTEREY